MPGEKKFAEISKNEQFSGAASRNKKSFAERIKTSNFRRD
jgi:hypothetical protein